MQRELRVWQKLDHKNVIKLYGTAQGFGSYASMISPWMENGNLHSYLERQGDALNRYSRYKIVRTALFEAKHINDGPTAG
jgi:serine/threonine protein kinase